MRPSVETKLRCDLAQAIRDALGPQVLEDRHPRLAEAIRDEIKLGLPKDRLMIDVLGCMVPLVDPAGGATHAQVDLYAEIEAYAEYRASLRGEGRQGNG